MSDTPTKDNTVVISDGAVEYSLDETAVPIDVMISSLEEAQQNGAEYVTGLSGNHRGPKYARLEVGGLETVADVLG